MRILVVDDHPLYREGIKALLLGLDPAATTLDASDVAAAVALGARGERFDLVILDMNLPGSSRLRALADVKAAFEDANVVVVSGDEDPTLILEAIEAGAAGYIPKSTDPVLMVNALRVVLAHGVYLPSHALLHIAAQTAPHAASRQKPADEGGTRAPAAAGDPMTTGLSGRQRAVLRHLLQGKSNKVIAREMAIAEGTVKAHLWAVYQILGVGSRAQAMCRVHELGMLEALAAPRTDGAMP